MTYTRGMEEPLEQSVGFLLSKLGFQTAAGFTAIMEPLGLAPPHFAVLRFIGGDEGRSQQVVAEAVGVPPSRIVAFVDVLEERGLVERRRNPADRRAHALHLTEEGRRVLEAAQAKADEYEQEVCAGLTGEERARLLELLQRIARVHEIPVNIHPGMRLEVPPMRRPD